MADAEALNTAMDQRRKILRKRWNAVAHDAGMTPQHLVRIRNGQVPLSEFTAAGIDQAMDWALGHAWEIYSLGSTTWLTERGLELRDDVERQLWALAELTGEERWAFIEVHRRQLRERDQAHDQTA